MVRYTTYFNVKGTVETSENSVRIIIEVHGGSILPDDELVLGQLRNLASDMRRNMPKLEHKLTRSDKLRAHYAAMSPEQRRASTQKARDARNSLPPL